MVPFKKKDKATGKQYFVAQFILGAKGYKQLAMRSGQYQDIDVIEIKEGEYKGRDKATGKQLFEFIEDDDKRDSLPTIGYMAYFELLNGFRKTVYWTKNKMIRHADTYSQAFNAQKYDDYISGKIPQEELYKYSSFWYKNFTEMAFKTLLRYLLSQWGIMSIEMQKAIDLDNATVNENGEVSYVEFEDGVNGTPVQDSEDTDKIEVSPAESEEFDFFADDKKE